MIRFKANAKEIIRKLQGKLTESLTENDINYCINILMSSISDSTGSRKLVSDDELKNHLNIIIQLCKAHFDKTPNISPNFGIESIDTEASVDDLETSIIEALVLSNRAGHLFSGAYFELKNSLTIYIVKNKEKFEEKGIKLYKSRDDSKIKNKCALDIVQSGYPLVSVHISNDTIQSEDFKKYKRITTYPLEYPPKRSPELYQKNLHKLEMDGDILISSDNKFEFLKYISSNQKSCNDLILFNTLSVMGLGVDELEKLKSVAELTPDIEDNCAYNKIKLSLKNKNISIDKIFDALNIPIDKEEFENSFRNLKIEDKKNITEFINEYTKLYRNDKSRVNEIQSWNDTLYNCYNNIFESLNKEPNPENFQKEFNANGDRFKDEILDLGARCINYYQSSSLKKEDVKKWHQTLYKCYGNEYYFKYLEIYWDTKVRENFMGINNKLYEKNGKDFAEEFLTNEKELKKKLIEENVSSKEVKNIMGNILLPIEKKQDKTIKKPVSPDNITIDSILPKKILGIVKNPKSKAGKEAKCVSTIIEWEKNQSQSIINKIRAQYPLMHNEIINRLKDTKNLNIQMNEEYFAQYLDWNVISSFNDNIELYYSDESKFKKPLLKYLKSSDRKIDVNLFKKIYRLIKEDQNNKLEITPFGPLIKAFEDLDLQKELPDELKGAENISIEDQIKLIAESSDGFKHLSEVGNTISRIEDIGTKE